MRIGCQKHYDKVAEYAKSIGDTTFQNCIDCLKHGKPIPKECMKLNCITTVRRIHSDLHKWLRTETGGLSEGCCIMADRMNLLP